MDFNRDKYLIKANVRKVTFQSGQPIDEHRVLLGENKNRVGFLIYNGSSNSIYLAFDPRAAQEGFYSTQIGANSEWEPSDTAKYYTGEITWNPASAGNGTIQVTEFVMQKRRKSKGTK